MQNLAWLSLGNFKENCLIRNDALLLNTIKCDGESYNNLFLFYSSEKYVLAADRGLVILSTTETDAGRWQLRYEDGDVSLQLCSYNVTVNIQKCSAPTQAPEFQKVYAEWCHEFQKYKKAMQLWQQKQEVRITPITAN